MNHGCRFLCNAGARMHQRPFHVVVPVLVGLLSADSSPGRSMPRWVLEGGAIEGLRVKCRFIGTSSPRSRGDWRTIRESIPPVLFSCLVGTEPEALKCERNTTSAVRVAILTSGS